MRNIIRLVSLTGFFAIGWNSIISAGNPNWSHARRWDEQLLQAIRINQPRPPVHARNLCHLSTAMYDAWAAYDTIAEQVVHHEKLRPVNAEVERAEAISFAAYRVLKVRFATGPGSAATQIALDAQMDELGYNKTNTSTVGNTAAALGNRVAASVLAYGLGDGSNEANNYADTGGYVSVNPPLIVGLPGTTMNDPNRWQPLALGFTQPPVGPPVPTLIQSFVTPHWKGVTPFALTPADMGPNAYLDPGLPPELGGRTDAQFKAEVIQVVRFSSWVDPIDGVKINISPGAVGNNPLGDNTGIGHALNPATGLPYAPNIVKRGDFGRVLAEFWADGPNSETPPGHWNVIANEASEHPLMVKKIGGTGPIVNDLEWDVKMYFVLNSATHDAAIGSWNVKEAYDWVRPISMIRYMGGLGQCTDLKAPSYHPKGLPLVEDLIELITSQTTAPGERHAHLAGFEGQIAIRAWKGQPVNPATEVGGVAWIRAVQWIPYQIKTFVTPAFPGYTSGHSTFSRSAAEALTHITGSPFVPGGLGSFTAPQNNYLKFEMGPSQTTTIQWASYYDAADQAGLSRLWGGIHVKADDNKGRIMGSAIGKKAFEKARDYFQHQVTCIANVAANTRGPQSVNVDDLLAVINGWGPCPAPCPVHCVADITNNCLVNVDDLLAVINAWGPCP